MKQTKFNIIDNNKPSKKRSPYTPSIVIESSKTIGYNSIGSIDIGGYTVNAYYNDQTKDADISTYKVMISIDDVPLVSYHTVSRKYYISASFVCMDKILRFIQRYHDGHHYKLTVDKSELIGDKSEAVALLLILKSKAIKIPKFVMFEILKYNMSPQQPGIIYHKFK